MNRNLFLKKLFKIYQHISHNNQTIFLIRYNNKIKNYNIIKEFNLSIIQNHHLMMMKLNLTKKISFIYKKKSKKSLNKLDLESKEELFNNIINLISKIRLNKFFKTKIKISLLNQIVNKIIYKILN